MTEKNLPNPHLLDTGVKVDSSSRTIERKRSTRGKLATALFLGLLTIGGGVAGGPKAVDALKKLIHPVKTAQAATPTSESTATSRLLTPTETPIAAVDAYNNLEPKPTVDIEALDNKVDHIATDIYGNKIELNKSGLPLRIITPEGEVKQLDINKVALLRQQAITQRHAEAIDVVRLASSEVKDDFTFSADHPATTELPSDVLSTDELAKKGVDIIQGNNTNLYIRQNAFLPGQPLEAFGDSGKKLTIVLVDGPVVSLTYLQEPKYDGVRNLLKANSYKNGSITTVNEMRQELEKYYLNRLKASLQTNNVEEIVTKEDNLSAGILQADTLFNQGMFKVIEQMSDLEIKDVFSIVLDKIQYPDQKVTALGMCLKDPINNKDTIFIATGKTNLTNYDLVFFDKDGFIRTCWLYLGSQINAINLIPKPSETYPEPELVIKKRTVGSVLRHEGVHTTQPYGYGQDSRQSMEEETDQDMALEILKNWTAWQKNGDNTGYCFVFSLPEGGYILTEKEPELKSDKKF